MYDLLLNEIKRTYEKKRLSAIYRAAEKREQVCSMVPQICGIDRDIKLLGIKYARLSINDSISSESEREEIINQIEELQLRKIHFLSEGGYACGVFDVEYECDLCKDRGYIDNESSTSMCSCMKQSIIDRLHSQANYCISELTSFANFNEYLYPEHYVENNIGITMTPRQYISKLKNRALKFVNEFENPEAKNLYFFGRTGVGKTYLCGCIANELVKKGYTVLYQSAPKLFDAINEHRLSIYRNGSGENPVYDLVYDVDLLIIDDLGSEPSSSSRITELLNILNIRHSNVLKKPCKTIISTNLTANDLYSYYDERIGSRIIGLFDIYGIIGDDIRIKKKLTGS